MRKEVEKTILRTKMISEELNSRSEQWERLNELLLVITTILIFNVFSLLIAVFQITSPDNGTAFNKRLIQYSKETIGISVFSIPNIF